VKTTKLRRFSMTEVLRQACMPGRRADRHDGHTLCREIMRNTAAAPELDVVAYTLLWLDCSGRRLGCTPATAREAAKFIAEVASAMGHASVDAVAADIRLRLDTAAELAKTEASNDRDSKAEAIRLRRTARQHERTAVKLREEARELERNDPNSNGANL